MITSVKVKGYRAIKNCKLEDLSRINIFIGRNNSGKSSVLEALYLASAAFQSSEPLGRYPNKTYYLLDRRSRRGLKWGQAKETLWHRYNTANPIELELKFLDANMLKIRLFDSSAEPYIEIDGELIESSFQVPQSQNLLAVPSAILFDPDSGRRLGIGKDGVHTCMHAFGADLRAFMRDFMFVDTSLIHRMEDVEKALWNDLLKDRLDKLVTQVLKQGYDMDVEDVTYVPYGKIYQLAAKLPKTTVRVDDLGDGARYSMIIIMIAALARNTALLFEELENHQHPGGLAKTLEMLLTLVVQNNIQVFASTHSIEFLRLVKKIASEKKIDLATFFLERDKAGNVESRRISPQDTDILEKMGLDPRFLDRI